MAYLWGTGAGAGVPTAGSQDLAKYHGRVAHQAWRVSMERWIGVATDGGLTGLIPSRL